jgi:two-component system, OmpR family, response regulator RegX3
MLSTQQPRVGRGAVNRRNMVASELLDALHVGVLLTDSRGRPMRANAAAQRLLGCQADGSAASEQVLALAGEAKRTGTACEQEVVLGQTVVRVRATPMEGGAVLELEDVSLARRVEHAYRDLLAAVGTTLLDRVEPLGLLVEVLAAADDPEHATRVFGQLREEANALVDLVGSPAVAEGPGEIVEPDRAGTDLSPAPQLAEPRPFSVDQPIVLLVHPADCLVEALTIGLAQAGLSVIAAKDIHKGLETVATVKPDAIVLQCPQGSLTAADAYAKVRAVTEAPVVLLVGGNENLAAELTDGSARDVVVLRRPLRFPELVAALHTLISQADPASALGSDVLAVGDVILDERAHAVRVRGEPIKMPSKEFELLRVLLGHAGQAISRERVIELVWGTDFATGRRNLHTHMKRLRQRIERDPTNPEYITTIRGFGYRFAAPSHSDGGA